MGLTISTSDADGDRRMWVAAVALVLADATAPDDELRRDGPGASTPGRVTDRERADARRCLTLGTPDSAASRAAMNDLAGLAPGMLDRLGRSLRAAGWRIPPERREALLAVVMGNVGRAPASGAPASGAEGRA